MIVTVAVLRPMVAPVTEESAMVNVSVPSRRLSSLIQICTVAVRLPDPKVTTWSMLL